MQNNNSVTEKINDIDIKTLLFNYLYYWKWFVLSLFSCLLIAWVYLRYNEIEYKIASIVLIKDEKKGSANELSAFSDMNLFSGKSSTDNQVAIFKSRSLSQNVVKSLDLDFSFATKGRLVFKERYKDVPFKLNFITKSKDYYKKDTVFNFKKLNNREFILSDANKSNPKMYYYNEKIKTNLGLLIVTLKDSVAWNSKNGNGNEIQITKTNLESRANQFNSKLNITPRDKTSVVDISITDFVSDKGIDYLNCLVDEFNKDALNDKNEVANKTSEFIAERLSIITKELDGVEGKAENYKISHSLTDIVEDSKRDLTASSEYEKSLVEVQTQMQVGKMMIDVVKNVNTSELIPTNIISSTETSAELINQYNKLILDRRKISKTGTNLNPVIQNIDAQLPSIKQNVLESLTNRQNNLNVNFNVLSKQKNIFDGKISQIPTHERNYNEIARQQKIKETLYLYLLQKREETQISLAVTSNNVKVIDPAYFAGPVTPAKSVFYLGALIIGLLIPLGIIFIIDFLDTKIKYRTDVEGVVSIPFLGDVPNSENSHEMIYSGNRTPTAEAIRIIRTNLEFILSNLSEEKCKTIFVTSSVPKEGKTFITVNLAATIALSGKKVLLIGADIRNPKLTEYLPVPSSGLTNYLSKKDAKIEDYIIPVKGYDDFSVLPSGVIPPNPSELLMTNKVTQLFAELKNNYDYILVDTAPVSVVTDTFLISKNADAFIFVMRANYLDKSMLKFAESIYQKKKLQNMSVVLNDTKVKKAFGYGHGYGYGYGYGYGQEEVKESWIDKLKSFFSFNIFK